jgi:hypothetical protein
MTKCFIKDVDSSLRRDFAGFGATNAVGDRKNAALEIAKERVFVQRALVIQAALTPQPPT